MHVDAATALGRATQIAVFRPAPMQHEVEFLVVDCNAGRLLRRAKARVKGMPSSVARPGKRLPRPWSKGICAAGGLTGAAASDRLRNMLIASPSMWPTWLALVSPIAAN
ncbi:hypothetical protein EFP18_06945 [Burkholderia glumae]|nr:hypothetical protein EFP18_06945 [Burkholderia glumae]